MTWDFQQCGKYDQQRLRPACAYAQSDQSLCLSLEYSMTFKPLTEHHLEFLSLKGGCTGSSATTLVKMPHCWKSCVTAQLWAWVLFVSMIYCETILLPIVIIRMILTLKAPIATEVVCFTRLLKCLRNLYGKQSGPWSDCSNRTSLVWIHSPRCLLLYLIRQ